MTFDLIFWNFIFTWYAPQYLFSTLSASSIAQDQVFQTCTSTPPGLAHRARTHRENMLQCPTLPLKNVRQRQHLITPPPPPHTHTKLFFLNPHILFSLASPSNQFYFLYPSSPSEGQLIFRIPSTQTGTLYPAQNFLCREDASRLKCTL